MKPTDLPFAGRTFPDPFPPACASAWGDDRYGLWCEIELGGVVQRLRWIEPGEFWMGSTVEERRWAARREPDEFKRYVENEAPSHRVRLTQGYWLADTACTQALWETVVGHNPSQFKGEPSLPVENVSWDDVMEKFLLVLNRQLSGVRVFLPTEAQWEYACRAGTQSAYHFGDLINTSQVNYHGDRQPLNGKDNEYRDCTVSVKALPVNRWGLFQMHGNVWEWCADARRSYTANAVVDPDGGQDRADRALRGGSWRNFARRARSAFRDGSRRDYWFQSIGFRFALRSIEQGAGGPGRAEPA